MTLHRTFLFLVKILSISQHLEEHLVVLIQYQCAEISKQNRWHLDPKSPIFFETKFWNELSRTTETIFLILNKTTLIDGLLFSKVFIFLLHFTFSVWHCNDCINISLFFILAISSCFFSLQNGLFCYFCFFPNSF